MESASVSTSPESYLYISKWQWQSDIDPWREKDSSKWTWTDYDEGYDRVIERGYIFKSKIADLGSYAIDFENMVQYKKDEPNRMRRVRRKEEQKSDNRFLEEISNPITFAEEDKTYSDPFGNVHHFLNYLMTLTSESKEIYQILENLSLAAPADQFLNVIDKVRDCIKNAGRYQEQNVSARNSTSSKNSFLEQARLINDELLDFKGNLQEFLKIILKVYTMETFICYWLNELLRNANIKELTNLSPFVVCLVYNFKINSRQREEGVTRRSSSLLSFIKDSFKPTWVSLYRGVVLTPDHVEMYKPKVKKYFSWYSFISTSRDEEIAKKFMKISYEKAQKENTKKVPVFFEIECELDLVENSLDVSMDSRYPHEYEVLLAPATVYKIISMKNKKDFVKVKLEVVKDLNKRKNEPLMGEIMKDVVQGSSAIFEGVSAVQATQTIRLLSGSTVVKKMVFKDYLFNNDDIMEQLKIVIPTLKILDEIEFNFFTDSDNISNGKRLSELLEVGRLNIFTLKLDWKKFDTSHLLSLDNLKNLSFHFDLSTGNTLVGDDEKEKKYKFYEKIPEYFRIIFMDSNPTNTLEKNSLPLFLKKISSYDVFNLIFFLNNENKLYPSPDIFKNIGEFRNLQSLLYSSVCDTNICDDDFEILSKSLRNLENLHTLVLKVNECPQLTDKCLTSLSSVFEKLPKLLLIEFAISSSENFTDEGACKFFEGLSLARSLVTIILNFNKCKKLTDKTLALLSALFLELKKIQNFSFNLGENPNISKISMLELCENLRFSYLKSLNLKFDRCALIDDDCLISLSKLVKQQFLLQNLVLNFYSCKEISDSGFSKLANSLASLKAPKSLCLYFDYCTKLSDLSISNLSNAIKSSQSLQSLVLYFSSCQGITDQGLKNLAKTLNNLSKLSNLVLNFEKCQSFTEKGLIKIFQATKSLCELENLQYNFNKCARLEEYGMSVMSSMFEFLIKLKRFTLNMSHSEVKTRNIIELSKNLKKSKSLKNVILDFVSCPQIEFVGKMELIALERHFATKY